MFQSIAKKRRLVYVKESYTTQKCSKCRRNGANTTCVPATHKGVQLTAGGKKYLPKIHGLRQCPHCASTWNRDFNAARNIHFETFQKSFIKRVTCNAGHLFRWRLYKGFSACSFLKNNRTALYLSVSPHFERIYETTLFMQQTCRV